MGVGSSSSSKTVAVFLHFLNWVCVTPFGKVELSINNGKLTMPLVDIEVIEGVFDDNQKAQMIQKVTNAMVEVEGEAMRGVTWVRVKEVRSGQWGIGGNTPSANDIKAMAAG